MQQQPATSLRKITTQRNETLEIYRESSTPMITFTFTSVKDVQKPAYVFGHMVPSMFLKPSKLRGTWSNGNKNGWEDCGDEVARQEVYFKIIQRLKTTTFRCSTP